MSDAAVAAGPAGEEVTPRSALRRAAVPLVVTLVVFGVASAFASQSARFDDFAWHFEPAWLAASLVCLVLYQAALCGVWNLLVGRLGGRLPARRAWAIWNVSLLARYVPTSALMTFVRVAQYERAGVPRRVTLVASVYELLLQLVVAVVIGAYWLLQLPEVEDHASRWVLLAVPALGLAALHPAILGRGVAVLLRRLGRGGEPVLLPVRQVLLACLLYTGCFALAGLGVLGLAASLHPVAPADAPLVVASFAIAFVVSVLAFVLPGGLGARETGLATALAPAMPFGVGLAVAVATRLAQLAIEVLFAFATYVIDRRGRPRAGAVPVADHQAADRPPAERFVLRGLLPPAQNGSEPATSASRGASRSRSE